MFFLTTEFKQVSVALMMLSLTFLSGCQQNPPREVIFNESGPTMSALYRNQTTRDVDREVGYTGGEGDGYTRDASNEIDVLFPELNNPRLVMFVFPHLSQNGHPVPGYSTAFYLYEGAQTFALPGEVKP